MPFLFSQTGKASHQAQLLRKIMLPMPCHGKSRATLDLKPKWTPFPPLPYQEPATCHHPFSKHLSPASTLALQNDWCLHQAQSYHLLHSVLHWLLIIFSEVDCVAFSTHQDPFLLCSACARCMSIKRISQSKSFSSYIHIALHIIEKMSNKFRKFPS